MASLVHSRKAEASTPPDIRGAVCFPQRFGGSLNLNVHYHVAVPDGVFRRESQGVGCRLSSAPDPKPRRPRGDRTRGRAESASLAPAPTPVRHGEAEQAEHDAEQPRESLDACLRESLGAASFRRFLARRAQWGEGMTKMHQLRTRTHSPAYSGHVGLARRAASTFTPAYPSRRRTVRAASGLPPDAPRDDPDSHCSWCTRQGRNLPARRGHRRAYAHRLGHPAQARLRRRCLGGF